MRIFFDLGNTELDNKQNRQGGLLMKNRRIIPLTIMLAVLAALSIGCAQNRQGDTSPGTTPSETTPDVTTTASIVDNAEDFKKAISRTGTWIICLTKDLTLNEEIVLDGEFTNGKKDEQGQDIIQRKIALYTQDENRNVTARFTLTAPKLTINSPNARIQSGTFKGDIYVSAENFELVDAVVDGNVYFTTDKAKSTFKMDEKSSVSGKQELVQE